MVTGIIGAGIRRLLRLLATAGVALIWLTIPAMGEPCSISVDRDHPKSFTPVDHIGRPQIMTSETGILFEEFIQFQENGESFLYASTPPEGSGAFMTEAIFWIAPDGTLHPVDFEHAGQAYENQVNEEEFILIGGPGILFSSGRLRFEFAIANQGDSRCCPTAGKISGTYKVVGEETFDPESKEYSCTFKLVVDKYKRDIGSSGELSGYIREK